MNNTTILPYVKLSLHIENPDLDDVWRDGYKSAEASELEESNPFFAGSTEHEFWEQGWWAGFYQEEPLFQMETATQTNVAITVSELIKHWYNSCAFVIDKMVNATLGAFIVYEVIGVVA